MRIQQSTKLIPILSLCVALTSVAACKSEIDDKPAAKTEDAAKTGDKAEAAEAEGEDGDAAELAELTLAADKSKVGFIGAKVTDDHKGSFEKISGTAKARGDALESIEITVDMSSVTTDAEKLTGHLQSEDFFHVEKYPESKFTSVSITEKAGEGTTHEIAGNLEMHGQTKKITFPATIETKDGALVGSADFKINRKDWGIDYAGMADDLIKDDVALQLELHFPKG